MESSYLSVSPQLSKFPKSRLTFEETEVIKYDRHRSRLSVALSLYRTLRAVELKLSSLSSFGLSLSSRSDRSFEISTCSALPSRACLRIRSFLMTCRSLGQSMSISGRAMRLKLSIQGWLCLFMNSILMSRQVLHQFRGSDPIHRRPFEAFPILHQQE